MKIASMALVSRKKDNEMLKNTYISLNTKNDTYQAKDFNNVAFRGSANRKPFEPKEDRFVVRNVQRNNFKESLKKLRAPFCKSYQKQIQEKIITRSCETLFECIKPYKDIRITRKAIMKESTQTKWKFFKTTDIVYEWKATREVQLFGFSDQKPVQNFFSKYKALLSTTGSKEYDNNLEKEIEPDCGDSDETEMNPNQKTGKTASSEDFITRVFLESEAEAAMI